MSSLCLAQDEGFSNSEKNAEHLFKTLLKFYKRVVLVPALALGVEAALAVAVEVEVGKRVGRR